MIHDTKVRGRQRRILHAQRHVLTPAELEYRAWLSTTWEEYTTTGNLDLLLQRFREHVRETK
jgi:hypothetical protein